MAFSPFIASPSQPPLSLEHKATVHKRYFQETATAHLMKRAFLDVGGHGKYSCAPNTVREEAVKLLRIGVKRESDS